MAYALMKSKITRERTRMPAYHCHYITDTNAGQTISNIGKLFQIFILPTYAHDTIDFKLWFRALHQQRCVRLDYSNFFNKQSSHVSFLLCNTVFRLIFFGFVYFTTVALLTYRYLSCLGPYAFHSTKSCRRCGVIPCQINRFSAIFPQTPSDSFEIWHTCRNCLETNIRQFFFI